jgi:hypothetical protein
VTRTKHIRLDLISQHQDVVMVSSSMFAVRNATTATIEQAMAVSAAD